MEKGHRDVVEANFEYLLVAGILVADILAAPVSASSFLPYSQNPALVWGSKVPLQELDHEYY